MYLLRAAGAFLGDAIREGQDCSRQGRELGRLKDGVKGRHDKHETSIGETELGWVMKRLSLDVAYSESLPRVQERSQDMLEASLSLFRVLSVDIQTVFFQGLFHTLPSGHTSLDLG